MKTTTLLWKEGAWSPEGVHVASAHLPVGGGGPCVGYTMLAVDEEHQPLTFATLSERIP